MAKALGRAFWRGFLEGANPLFILTWLLYGLGHLASLITNRGGPQFWVVFWARIYQALMLGSVRMQDRFGFSGPWSLKGE